MDRIPMTEFPLNRGRVTNTYNNIRNAQEFLARNAGWRRTRISVFLTIVATVADPLTSHCELRESGDRIVRN